LTQTRQEFTIESNLVMSNKNHLIMRLKAKHNKLQILPKRSVSKYWMQHICLSISTIIHQHVERFCPNLACRLL